MGGSRKDDNKEAAVKQMHKLLMKIGRAKSGLNDQSPQMALLLKLEEQALKSRTSGAITGVARSYNIMFPDDRDYTGNSPLFQAISKHSNDENAYNVVTEIIAQVTPIVDAITKNPNQEHLAGLVEAAANATKQKLAHLESAKQAAAAASPPSAAGSKKSPPSEHPGGGPNRPAPTRAQKMAARRQDANKQQRGALSRLLSWPIEKTKIGRWLKGKVDSVRSGSKNQGGNATTRAAEPEGAPAAAAPSVGPAAPPRAAGPAAPPPPAPQQDLKNQNHANIQAVLAAAGQEATSSDDDNMELDNMDLEQPPTTETTSSRSAPYAAATTTAAATTEKSNNYGIIDPDAMTLANINGDIDEAVNNFKEAKSEKDQNEAIAALAKANTDAREFANRAPDHLKEKAAELRSKADTTLRECRLNDPAHPVEYGELLPDSHPTVVYSELPTQGSTAQGPVTKIERPGPDTPAPSSTSGTMFSSGRTNSTKRKAGPAPPPPPRPGGPGSSSRGGTGS